MAGRGRIGHMAWETQGPLYARRDEHLGASDAGIVMFREMLARQIDVVREGGEPMALIRDPERNRQVNVICRREGLPADQAGIYWVEPDMAGAASSARR